MEFKTCAEFAFSNLEKKIKEFNLFKKKIYIYISIAHLLNCLLHIYWKNR